VTIINARQAAASNGRDEVRGDKLHENAVPKEEAVYELMEVGPFP